MKYQKPYIISGPKKPYIVPDVTNRPTLAQQVVKTVHRGGIDSDSSQKELARRALCEREELPSVYHNCPL